MNEENLSPRCSVCGRPSAVVKLVGDKGSVRFIYSGPGGWNGNTGDPVSDERAQALRSALAPPFTSEKLRAAGLHDEAGFCARCSQFYCSTHWNVSGTGGGRCPKGHFRSLDPHWSPE